MHFFLQDWLHLKLISYIIIIRIFFLVISSKKNLIRIRCHLRSFLDELMPRIFIYIYILMYMLHIRIDYTRNILRGINVF